MHKFNILNESNLSLFKMYCLECGHQITDDFAKFCDHCGTNLSKQKIIEKNSVKKVVTQSISIEEGLTRAGHIFAIWVTSLIVVGLFFVIYQYQTHNLFLPIAGLVGLLFIWMILLFVLEDLAYQVKVPSLQFVYVPLIFPIVGTFFSYFYLINRAQEK